MYFFRVVIFEHKKESNYQPAYNLFCASTWVKPKFEQNCEISVLLQEWVKKVEN